MRRLVVIHPFLFAIFPILSLFSSNVDIVDARDLALPIVIVGLSTVFLWLSVRAFVGSIEGAGIVVSVFWLLFFSYGGLQYALGPGHDLLLVIALATLYLLVAYGVKRQHRRMQRPALIMTAVGGALVLMPALSAGPALVRLQQTRVGAPNVEAPLASADERPDIYYIILDGYARGDVLEDIYQYDNSPFLDGLASRGFYVAQRSGANYAQTNLSLASSLNLCYLDSVVSGVGRHSDNLGPTVDMVRENAVSRFLREQGYTYVTFSSGYFEAELSHADVHIAARWSLSHFDQALVGITPLSCLRGLQYGLHRERLRYVLNHLQDPTEMACPVFVFAHILAPHWPFVFGEHGEDVAPEEPFSLNEAKHDLESRREFAYSDGYLQQLSFINVQVLAAVDAIIAKSSRPPIIILQSDHGPTAVLDWSNPDSTGLRERMSILNAYYLPGGAHDALYDEITPVNTFRLIFNQYFGADYDMLEDESYFSPYSRPYEFVQVLEPLQ